ncbi:DUF4239 domain-containing protein [Actinomadura barringtoniae]|uniref:DUF4239 domain-containing protein n=1 Tax=Actinomadura barringtoniae TaxID=1427535 RepID=A0A939T9I2_9ACTN|nr:DUF4239 domain-containing protein [Actinomadura barringtoniae]MBO2448000.1 DUF4239 domain-containing protein [Actinomadura barringtoniae]
MLIKSILAALVAVALVAAVAFVFKKYGKTDDEPDGATGSHVGAMLSALFLLVFAIALIVPWAAADEERKNTAAEAQALVEAYWDSGMLAQADKQAVRTEIKAYLEHTVNTEFPRLKDGGDPLTANTWQRLDQLRIRLANLKIDDDQVNAARDDAVERVREVYSARRQRAVDTGPILPGGVLFFTVLTGIIMIIFPFLVGARPKGMPLVALGIMAALLGISIFLCFDVNHVFTGPLAVKADAFSDALNEIARIP